jgi:hypothetical protein
MMMCGSKARWLDERDSLWLKGGFTTEITERHRGREGHVWVGKRTVFAGSGLPDAKAAAGCAQSMALALALALALSA